MSELRELLERSAGRFEPPPGGWDRLLRRASRRRARGRVTAGFVAMVVAGAGIGVVMAAFRNAEHHQPAATVENGLIAFGSGTGIYTMNPDGSGLALLQDPGAVAYYDPQWSPDGTKIAFYGYPRGGGSGYGGGADYDIFVMNADGSGLTNLTTSPADVKSGFSQMIPMWSPDGTKIAYDGDDGLYVMNADGSGQTRIASGQNPSWSPDGTKIAFEGPGGAIWGVAPDGTGLAQLTSGAGFDGFPAYSPDGTKIAYYHGQGSDRAIYVMNTDGSEQSVVADFQADTMGRPVWSPDGTKIAFDLLLKSYAEHGTWDIYVANVDGSSATDVTPTQNRDENTPVWSPDGTEISFEATNVLASKAPPPNEGTFDIYVMSPDGMAETRLTQDVHSLGFDMSWQLVVTAGLTPTPSTIIPPPAGELAIAARTPVPGAVDLALGFGSVWVSGFGELTRLDPVTDRIQATISVHGVEDFSDVAVGDGSVWVSADGGIVYRVDPGTSEVIATIRTGLVDMSLAVAADGYLWVASPGTGATDLGTLIRIDPQTGLEVGTPISVGTDPHVVVFDEGSLWVSGGAGIERVDPATGAVTKVPGALRTYSLALGAGSIWSTTFVSSTDALTTDRVLRIDPTTMRVVDEIPIPRASAVAFADGFVWVMTSPTHKHPETTVLRIDPATDHVVGNALRLPGSQPIAMVAQGTSAWIADYTDQTLTRVEAVSAGPSD